MFQTISEVSGLFGTFDNVRELPQKLKDLADGHTLTRILLKRVSIFEQFLQYLFILLCVVGPS